MLHKGQKVVYIGGAGDAEIAGVFEKTTYQVASVCQKAFGHEHGGQGIYLVEVETPECCRAEYFRPLTDISLLQEIAANPPRELIREDA